MSEEIREETKIEDKIRVEVMFRNGHTIHLHCGSFEVKTSGGKFTGYNYKDGVGEEQVLFMSIPDIVCIRRCDEIENS